MGEGLGALPAVGVFAGVLLFVHLFIHISFPFPVVGIESRALYILGPYSITELLLIHFSSFRIFLIIIKTKLAFIAFRGVSWGLFCLSVCPFMRWVMSAVGSLPVKILSLHTCLHWPCLAEVTVDVPLVKLDHTSSFLLMFPSVNIRVLIES